MIGARKRNYTGALALGGISNVNMVLSVSGVPPETSLVESKRDLFTSGVTGVSGSSGGGVSNINMVASGNNAYNTVTVNSGGGSSGNTINIGGSISISISSSSSTDNGFSASLPMNSNSTISGGVSDTSGYGGGLWGANYYDYSIVEKSLDLWATQQQQTANGFSQSANNWWAANRQGVKQGIRRGIPTALNIGAALVAGLGAPWWATGITLVAVGISGYQLYQGEITKQEFLASTALSVLSIASLKPPSFVTAPLQPAFQRALEVGSRTFGAMFSTGGALLESMFAIKQERDEPSR